MIPDGYRVFVAYDDEKKKFIARVPELGDLQSQGDTRTEALAGAEEQVEQAFRKAAEEGLEMPSPIDATEYSGEITLNISPSLHREIAFLAVREGMEIHQVAAEALSAGVASRFMQQYPRQPRDNRGSEKRERDNRRSPRGNRYFNIMDDRANFMEYVRNLEGGGGRGGRRGGRNRGRKS